MEIVKESKFGCFYKCDHPFKDRPKQIKEYYKDGKRIKTKFNDEKLREKYEFIRSSGNGSDYTLIVFDNSKGKSITYQSKIFTGLYDKNNNKIFIGDLIEVNGHKYCIASDYNDKFYYIRYSEKSKDWWDNDFVLILNELEDFKKVTKVKDTLEYSKKLWNQKLK